MVEWVILVSVALIFIPSRGQGQVVVERLREAMVVEVVGVVEVHQ